MYGRCPIIVLDVEGERRSVWLTQTALRSKFAEELERRGAADFTPGEPVSIERATEMKESGTGKRYWPFSVAFGNAPTKTAAAILAGTETVAPAGGGGSSSQLGANEPLPFR